MGTWVDASILITDYEPKFFNNDLFYFSVITDNYTAGSNWFLNAEKGSPILRMTRDLLYEFWRNTDYLKEYLIFYIFFKFACDYYIDDNQKVEVYPNHINKLLQNVLTKPYNKRQFEKILNQTSIHKLVVRMNIKSRKELFYQHIIKLYKKNNEK